MNVAILNTVYKEKNAPAKNITRRVDNALPASKSSHKDSLLWEVSSGTPFSSQGSVRCRFRRSRHERKDWRSPLRRANCWDTRGIPLLWFLGQWRWMLYPDPASLPLCKDTWGLPSSWMRCKIWEIWNGNFDMADTGTNELNGWLNDQVTGLPPSLTGRVVLNNNDRFTAVSISGWYADWLTDWLTDLRMDGRTADGQTD